MKALKILSVAAALTVLPGLALAMGCSHGKHEQVQSCASGTSWDAATSSCVPTANS